MALRFVVLATTLLAVGTCVAAPAVAEPFADRNVSIMVGCLTLPYNAKVVLSESFPDAQMGYVQLHGDPRRVSWAAGMIGFRLGPSGNYAPAITESGIQFKYGTVVRRGQRSLVAQVGLVEFSIDSGGDTNHDLEYLLSIARGFRDDLPKDTCQRPEK